MVIGRHNHHGSRSKRGTEVSAILYTLVESARLAGVATERYVLLCAKTAAGLASADTERGDPREAHARL